MRPQQRQYLMDLHIRQYLADRSELCSSACRLCKRGPRILLLDCMSGDCLRRPSHRRQTSLALIYVLETSRRRKAYLLYTYLRIHNVPCQSGKELSVKRIRKGDALSCPSLFRLGQFDLPVSGFPAAMFLRDCKCIVAVFT